MKKTIAVLAGDGIGQEVVPQAIRVLAAIAKKFNHTFIFEAGDVGGAAFEKHHSHFPDSTRKLCQQADAILFGSVGGPVSESHLQKWQNCERNSILALRKALNLQVNIRPIQAKNNIDFIVLRELLGDIYFGEHRREIKNNKRVASDVAEYNEDQIAAIAHRGFQFARARHKKVTSVDKANVLETSKLWREVVSEIAKEYSDIQLEHMLIDNCTMQIILNPAQFDVILTSNLFGDILSDEAAALVGSLGLIPSASLNASNKGLYEPAGGSAPDIAGKNIANPIAQILSSALLLRYSFALEQEASTIENAVQKALQAGFKTKDICIGKDLAVTTDAMTTAILNYL